jgi:GT2 family glycosyltransferase
MPEVAVAIPVRNGGQRFDSTLDSLSRQTVAHELLVCDSGSHDGSPDLARAQGARVLKIDPAQFSHGGTRNLLMRESSAAHVAFLTQDAEPADERWLEHLLGGFELAKDVGMVYGPYLPRPGTSAPVRLELERWFGSLASDDTPRVDRLGPGELPELAGASQLSTTRSSASRGPLVVGAANRGLPVSALLGSRGFFTDANACISRAAWEQVPFREVPYAEDRVLAIDMLRAGFAKVYMPGAAVLHSHDYTASQQLRRCFDEWRGLLEVYGWREPASPRQAIRKLRGELSWVRQDLERSGASPSERRVTLAAVTGHHVVRLAGELLGSNADRLPPGIRRRLSLEGRASFLPLRIDQLTETASREEDRR